MLKKFGMGLALTATFGLLACDDSSSGSDGGTVTVSCKVESENPLVTKMSEGGISFTTKYELDKDGKLVQTYEYSSQAIADDECTDLEKEMGEVDVTCEGKKVIVVDREPISEKVFKTTVDIAKSACQEMDGKKVSVNGDDEDGGVPGGKDNGGIGSKDGDEGGSAPKTSSCEFDVNKDVWEYTTSSEDMLGSKHESKTRYEFKGKDYTVTTESKTSGGYSATAQCSDEVLEAYNYEEDDPDTGSIKSEASCDGNVFKLKTVQVVKNYEEQGFTKESLVTTLTAACQAGY